MSEETPDDLDWPFPVQPSLMSDDELDLLAAGADGPTSTPTLQPDEGEEPLAPINWNLLSPEDAQVAWLDLNVWVNWLRHAYGLPPTLIPPLWHRHDELVWELSALHTHWLACYDPGASPSAPIAWHRDFADARNRLREWVATSGSRLDRDRPTRTTTWPGEEATETPEERVITNRDADFAAFVADDILDRAHTRQRAWQLAAEHRRQEDGGGA
ncbi:hypothetical protein [Georgenia sp. AZ-5]|uniref:hypothetical protein n=1 Tax=Georgenia sp. AZ-5 TaxID=3367526 RepID=UPI003754ED7E